MATKPKTQPIEPIEDAVAGDDLDGFLDGAEPDDALRHARRGRVRQVERAETDLYIARPDLGPGIRTFVRAGGAIPPGIADLPRTPA